MLVTNESTCVWLAPQRLQDRWQPEMFRPEFRELERILAQPSQFVHLRELVQVVQPGAGDAQTKWHVDHSGVTRRFQGADVDTSSSLPGTVLPDEALLVGRAWTQAPLVRYWNSRLFHGNATAGWGFLALVGRTGQSIAWLRRELESEFGVLQLNQRSLGTVQHHITTEDLLDLQVRRLSPQSQDLASREVYEETSREASTLRSKRLSKTFVLTARTFESRLSQFEEYLIAEGLFSTSDAFFVESATRVPNSDLFTIRPLMPTKELGNPKLSATALMPQDSSAANETWRAWFWNGAEDEYHQVFNSFLSDDELPTYLMTRLVAPLPETVMARAPKMLPSFSTFRETVLPSIKKDVGVEEQLWGDTWCELQDSCDRERPAQGEVADAGAASGRFEFEHDLYAWSRQTYRPVLAIKVRRSDAVIGAYLLVGDDQIDDWTSAYTRLDDRGISLGEVFHPPSELMQNVARQESLRRLMVVMHHIKGAAGLANNALVDVKTFLDRNPGIASQLVPDAAAAKGRAESPFSLGINRETLVARVEDAQQHLGDVNKLWTQLLRLRKVQSDLKKRRFRLDQLLADCARRLQESNPEINIEASHLTDVQVRGNEESIRDAINEVLFNARREVLEHQVPDPTIRLRCGVSGPDAWLHVSDNGLPEEKPLLAEPFEEGRSAYETSGRGTGFGLTIVRETFRCHGGDCSLEANFDDDFRARGVTFLAHLPVLMEGNDHT